MKREDVEREDWQSLAMFDHAGSLWDATRELMLALERDGARIGQRIPQVWEDLPDAVQEWFLAATTQGSMDLMRTLARAKASMDAAFN